MAEARDDATLYWISPEARGVIPLDGLHISRRLARTIRSDRFVVTSDTAFAEVIAACAASAPGREQTWINREIEELYVALHARGHAHSIECWRDGRLAGGLYGVKLGAAFFGESMFSRERDASKVALAHLVARLRVGGFTLLDTQFITAHLVRLGAREIPREVYLGRLARAVASVNDPYVRPKPDDRLQYTELPPLAGAVDATGGASWPGWLVLQLITQTS